LSSARHDPNSIDDSVGGFELLNASLALVELAGHVGLLLWGTHMVSTGVQRGFGSALQRWLGRNLDTRFRSFFTGLGITAVLQSSTATGLLVTSFTATGVISLAPALAVMLGANVGTALLTQVFSLNTALIGPPLVLLGVLGFRWASKGQTKNIGRIGIGLGLMLMALAGLVHTLASIEGAPLLRPVVGALADDPVIAVLLAALLTWACHSSIAMVLLVASFAASSMVSPIGALALVLGANLGGALPTLASATTIPARRLPVGNLIVRASGVAACVFFLPQIASLMSRMDTNPGQVAVDFHLLFNLILAILYLGSVERLAQLLARWMPDRPAAVDPARPVHLDKAGLGSATVALVNASRETLRMADMLEAMLRDALEVLLRDDRERSSAIAANARCVDQLGDCIRIYLADIGDEHASPRGQDILSAVINLEHVADILANSLADCSLRSLKRGRRLELEEQEIISAMTRELLDTLHLSVTVFLQAQVPDAERLIAKKGTFREFESKAMILSVKLLRAAAEASSPDSVSAERVAEDSGLFLRAVRDLRRVDSHLVSFAYPVLHHYEDVPRSKGDTRLEKLPLPQASDRGA
jgi:phosphate:Na+ symporter